MKIDPRYNGLSPVRITKRVLDGKAHIRLADLGKNRSVAELHHGMYQTLRLYHDADFFHRHTEQKTCLDHLQTFVYQCRGVDRDFRSHAPVRVLQCILRAHIFQFFPLFAAERPAGSSDPKLVDFSVLPALQALEQRAVLAVNRENLHMVFRCQRHNQMPGRDQRLLIGQRNVLSCLYGCHSRTDSDHPDNRGDQNIRFRHLRQFDQSVHAGCHTGIRICNPHPQIRRRLFASGNRQKRMEFPHLLFQKLHIPVRRKPGYLNITVFSYHIQGLCPD